MTFTNPDNWFLSSFSCFLHFSIYKQDKYNLPVRLGLGIEGRKPEINDLSLTLKFEVSILNDQLVKYVHI